LLFEEEKRPLVSKLQSLFELIFDIVVYKFKPSKQADDAESDSDYEDDVVEEAI